MAAQGSGAELMELVTQMRGTIEQHFLPTIHELDGKMQSELLRVHDWIHDVADAIKEVKPKLHDDFQAAQQKIHGTEEVVKQEVDLVVQSITAFVGHLHDAKGQAHELLSTAVTHTGDVMQKLDHADETHATVGDQISHALGEITGHASDHLTTLESHHNQITEALNGLHEHADGHVTDLAAKLQQTGEAVTEHVTTLVQVHVSNAGELVGQQKDHLIGVVTEAVGGHANEMITHVQGFVQLGTELGHTFDGGFGDVLSKVEQISHLLEEIKPVIELVKELE
jgi:gas vesicle protein